jgi:hypothetical protein
MKSPTPKALIKLALKELTWPYLERLHDGPIIRIVSNPANESHIIMMPDKLNNRSSNLDYLHEIGHAIFCERVHPIFAANILYPPLMNRRQFVQVVPALNVACDWFIGHWQYEKAPERAQKMMKSSLKVVEKILKNKELPPLEIILHISLLIAQAIHYLDEPIDCGGPLKLAVDSFLAIPPDKPSLDNCVQLVNKLLETYTDQRVRFREAGDNSSWEMFPAAATTAKKGKSKTKRTIS